MSKKQDIKISSEETLDESLVENIDDLGDESETDLNGTDEVLDNERCTDPYNTNEEATVDLNAYYAEIPLSLSEEDKSRLNELCSHSYIKSEDEFIILERESLILLKRAIQIKALAEDEFKSEELDESLKQLAAIYFVDSRAKR